MLDERQDHPPGDGVLRTCHAGGLELLLDDELFHRAGVAPPRLGPVRHDVTRLDHGVALARRVQTLDPLGERPHLVAHRLGLRRQVDRAPAPRPAPHQVGDVPRRRLRVHHRFERGGAAEIQVGVVLPREADAAVHLDVELRGLVGRGQRERGRHGRGQRQLLAPFLGGPGGIPHGRGGELGRHEHVGAVVLDGLEGADRPAELHAHLGVRRGLLGALGGDAGGLGGEDEPRQVDEHPPAAVDHLGGCAVEGDVRGPSRRVEVVRNLDGDAPRRRIDDDGVVPRDEDEDVGEAAAQDRRHRSGGRASRHGDIRGQPDSAEGRPVGQAGQQVGGQLVGRRGVDDRAGDDGRHEGPRCHGAAELLRHHHQLGQPEARAAPVLGEVQAEPAEGGQVPPERGQGLGVGLEQGAGGPAGIVLGQEFRGRLAQGAVLFGDCYRHA